MERCHGKTKAGARCKRSAGTGSRFCSIHADQAGATRPEPGKKRVEADPREPSASGETTWDSDLLEPLVALAVAGAVALVALTLRRLLRFL